MSLPPVSCISGVEFQLMRLLGLAHRARPHERRHVTDPVAVCGAEGELGEARELAGVVRQMVTAEVALRSIAFKAQAAERYQRRLAQPARLRHPVPRANLAEDRRVVEEELDVTIGFARVLEDHE